MPLQPKAPTERGKADKPGASDPSKNGGILTLNGVVVGTIYAAMVAALKEEWYKPVLIASTPVATACFNSTINLVKTILTVVGDYRSNRKIKQQVIDDRKAFDDAERWAEEKAAEAEAAQPRQETDVLATRIHLESVRERRRIFEKEQLP